MKYLIHITLILTFKSSAIYALSSAGLESGLPAAKAHRSDRIYQFWQPALPHEPEYDRPGLALRIAMAIEQMAENKNHSSSSINKLVVRMLTGPSVTATPPANIIASLPPGTVYEYGAGGSKTKKSSQPKASDSAKKTAVSTTTSVIAGQSFILRFPETEDDEIHQRTMEAIVFEAIHTRKEPAGNGRTSNVHKIDNDGISYAVKEAKLSGFVPELIREGELLLDIDHPNIIRIKALAHSETRCFMVFEYYPADLWGLKLDKKMQRPVTEAEAVLFVGQLLSALEYLHQKGYSHSDFKPENIFVSSENGLILGDLGNLSSVDKKGPGQNSGIYVAPEVGQGQKPSQLSDLWELGIVIAFLLMPEKISYMLNTKAGYMNAYELIPRHAKEEGHYTLWGSILQIDPDKMSKDLSPEDTTQWHLLSDRAFLFALVVMCLRYIPDSRPGVVRLKKLVEQYLAADSQ